MSQLYNFLTNVAANPQRQAAFLYDPGTVMAMAGLTEEDQSILQSGDRSQIVAAFANELPWCASIFREPDPDPSPDPDSFYKN
jgi:hypothetical protein